MQMSIIRKKVYLLFGLILCIIFYSNVLNHQHLSTIDQSDPSNPETSIKDERFESLLQETLNLTIELESLKEKIFHLDQQLLLCNSERDQKINFIKKNLIPAQYHSETQLAKLQAKFNSNELDLYPYSAFTSENYFPVEHSIYNRQVIKLTGLKQNHLASVISTGLEYLNRFKRRYELNQFQIGFARSSPFDGHEYELYFKNGNDSNYVKLRRPLQAVKVSNEKKVFKQVIHFILPVAGKLNAVKFFLTSFELVALNEDRRFSTLTIVYSYDGKKEGIEGLRQLKTVLEEFQQRTKFFGVKLVKVLESRFSRANLLEQGVHSCCNNRTSNLLFFCDVDILFTQNFLDLCRLNTHLHRRVFFPVLYSYFNPGIYHVNKLHDLHAKMNSPKEFNFSLHDPSDLELTINNDFGHWRESGFGMTCLYREDFISVGGFGELFKNKSDWGGEDRYLVRRFLRSDLEVFRAVTPGLFHLYHHKECKGIGEIAEKEYEECMMVKISNEASLKTLGMAYFNKH